MIDWNGANYTLRGICDKCGKRRQCGYIHFIGKRIEEDFHREGNSQTTNYLPDHLQLCSECWKNIPQNWHPCGCGG
jgi:hypothetical protein